LDEQSRGDFPSPLCRRVHFAAGKRFFYPIWEASYPTWEGKLASRTRPLFLPILGCIIPNMGEEQAQTPGLAGALFSRVQLRVLALLFGNPAKEYSTSEVIRHVESGTGAVHRELARLASSGIVQMHPVGNQKRYSANRSSPIYEELRSLIQKTAGLAQPIREALWSYKDQIQAAFVYGSTAKGGDTSDSDIDVMILGDDLSYSEIFNTLTDTERHLGRKISPNIMTPADWQRKLRSKNSFINRVAAEPKLFIFGSDDDVGGIEWAGRDRPA
jgi:predicted nucleotidyltransferase